MKTSFILIACLLISTCSKSQLTESKPVLVGGPCEGCEAVFEYGDKELLPEDTLPDFDKKGTKLKITGIIYQHDGKTPASDVILYIYHTNQEGIYPTRGGETKWERRHGYIRGWVKTNADGKYTLYTLKPGTYPDRSSPAHIHITVLEPNGKYYWIDSYHFEDDPLLLEKERSPAFPRGGSSGVLTLRKEGSLLVGERDIIIGLHVEDYD